MENKIKTLVVASFLSSLAVSGCSSLGAKSPENFAYTGPTVLETRADPTTFQLNDDLNPKTTDQVVTTVKDYGSKVTDVRLRFKRVPITVVLKRGEGDQWVGNFSKTDLQRLAVAGETMKYDATIIAKNEKGEVATSRSPLSIYVETPQVLPENS
jgi:hypothetical protein